MMNVFMSFTIPTTINSYKTKVLNISLSSSFAKKFKKIVSSNMKTHLLQRPRIIVENSTRCLVRQLPKKL